LLPRATGTDYELRTRVRAGATLGNGRSMSSSSSASSATTILWLRGHAGLGRPQGRAPLAAAISDEWEMDKTFTAMSLHCEACRFFDTGSIAALPICLGRNAGF